LRRAAVQPTGELSATKEKRKRREDKKMGNLMIKCPQTGYAIPTGVKTDRESFRCSAVFFARTYCSICKVNHEWFAKDAWISELRHGESALAVR
jgi:hypothetical protein